MSKKLFFDYLENEYKIVARIILIIILFFQTVFFIYDYGFHSVISENFIEPLYLFYDISYFYQESVVYPLWDFFAGIGLYNFHPNEFLDERISYPIMIFIDYLISIYPIIILFVFSSLIYGLSKNSHIF